MTEQYEHFFFGTQNNLLIGIDDNCHRRIYGISKDEVDVFIEHNMTIIDAIDLFSSIYIAKALNDYKELFQIKSKLLKLGLNSEYYIPTENLYDKVAVRKKKNTIGFIYILKSGCYYKIGKTKNLKTRITKYITENPAEIEIIHTYKVDDYTNEETRIHNKFQHKRHRGEWYSLSEDDIAYLKSIN